MNLSLKIERAQSFPSFDGKSRYIEEPELRLVDSTEQGEKVIASVSLIDLLDAVNDYDLLKDGYGL
jgi:hypothetical protein